MKSLIDENSENIDWTLIAASFVDRSDVQLESRWRKVLSPDLIKGPWTKEVIVELFRP